MGNDAGHTIGSHTEIIDASGKTLIPGLIDGHTYLAWYYTLEEFLKYAVKGGTTTIITETVELSFPLGYEGIMEYLESAKDQPIKIFFTVPPMPNISPLAESRAMDVETLRKLLQHDVVLGLGEMYWSSIIKGNDRIYDLFAETLAANKVLEGHAAGARGKRLISYMASGVSSCHEATSVEEALERLRLGVNAMIREGDIRMELPAISKIKDSGIDFRRLTQILSHHF